MWATPLVLDSVRVAEILCGEFWLYRVPVECVVEVPGDKFHSIASWKTSCWKKNQSKVNVNHFMAGATARFRFYDSFFWNFNPKDIFLYLCSPFLLNSFILCAKLQVKHNITLYRNWSHRPTCAAQIFNHSPNCKDQAPASSVRISLK